MDFYTDEEREKYPEKLVKATKVMIDMSGWDLEVILGEAFKGVEFCFGADHEMSDDSSATFHVAKGKITSEWDQKALADGKVQYNWNLWLNAACDRDIIPAGEYVVTNVS